MSDISNSSKSAVNRLALILALGLIVRLALWLACDGAAPQIVDAIHYDELASQLAEHDRYSEASGNLSSIRPPLYPWFVSVVYRVMGIGNYAAVYAVQIAVSLLTTCFVFGLGKLIYDETVAVWAAGLFCFYPSFLAYDNLLLTEVLATFLLTTATLATVVAVRRASWPALVAAGVLYGLAALTRSAALMFMPFLAIWLWFAWPQGRLRGVAAAGAVVTMFALTIAPWAYRNTQLQGTLTLIDVMGGRNAMMGNYEYTPLDRSWATIGIATGEQSWISVLIKNHPTEFQSGLTQGKIDKLALREALQYMKTHPGQTLLRSTVKCLNFWQLEREVVAGVQQGFWGTTSRSFVLTSAIVICGYYAACLFAAIFGALFTRISSRWIYPLLLQTIAVPWAAHTLIFAHSRYHLPFVPILAVFAGSAIVHRRETYVALRSRRGLFALSLCAILVASWFRELAFVDLNHLM